MNQLLEYKYSILASLRAMPGTFEEITKRDFLNTVMKSSMGEYAVDNWLRDLIKENLVYKRGETYHAYKTAWVDSVLSKYGFD